MLLVHRRRKESGWIENNEISWPSFLGLGFSLPANLMPVLLPCLYLAWFVPTFD